MSARTTAEMGTTTIDALQYRQYVVHYTTPRSPYLNQASTSPSSFKSVCRGGATSPHTPHVLYAASDIQCVMIGFNCVPRSVQWKDSFWMITSSSPCVGLGQYHCSESVEEGPGRQDVW